MRRAALILAAVGTVLCVAEAFLDTRALFSSYLWSYLFVLALSLGAMAVGAIHTLTGGEWGRQIRGVLDAATAALPYFVWFFIPLLPGLNQLYPWMAGGPAAHDPALERQAWYLGTDFFLIRSFTYLLVWGALAVALGRIPAEEREARSPRSRRLSIIVLIVYALSVTLASVDWIMSLEPRYHSSEFGLLVGVEWMLSAVALGVICTTARATPAPASVPTRVLIDLGSLLLVFVLAWAYLAFMQYLTTWIANLPREIAWYGPRVETSWRWLSIALMTVHFWFPFFLLLLRRVKRQPARLRLVAVLLLTAHLVDVFWLVEPSLYPEGFVLHLSDAGALLALGGLWFAMFTGRLLPAGGTKAYGSRAAAHRRAV